MTDASIWGVLCFFTLGLAHFGLPLDVLFSDPFVSIANLRFTGALGSTDNSSSSNPNASDFPPSSSSLWSSSPGMPMSALSSSCSCFLEVSLLQYSSLFLESSSARIPSSRSLASSGHFSLVKVWSTIGLLLSWLLKSSS